MNKKYIDIDENEVFKENLRQDITNYLTKINRLKDYDVNRITDDLNKIKLLNNINNDDQTEINKPMDYVLNYFEKIQKK